MNEALFLEARTLLSKAHERFERLDATFVNYEVEQVREEIFEFLVRTKGIVERIAFEEDEPINMY